MDKGLFKVGEVVVVKYKGVEVFGIVKENLIYQTIITTMIKDDLGNDIETLVYVPYKDVLKVVGTF